MTHMIRCPIRMEDDQDRIVELEKTLNFYFGPLKIERINAEIIELTSSVSLDEQHIISVVTHFLNSSVPTANDLTKRADRPRHSPSCACNLFEETRLETGQGLYTLDESWLSDLDKLLCLCRRTFGSWYRAPHYRCPSLIKVEVLRRAGYFKKFASNVGMIHHLRRNYWDSLSVSRLNDTQSDALSSFYVTSDYALNPVTCYQVWANRARMLPTGNCVVSIDGKVFRHEGLNHTDTRLAEFSMYELVAAGETSYIADMFARLAGDFERFFSSLELTVDVVPAADSFVGEDAGLRKDIQLRAGHKLEFRVSSDGAPLAIASVNMHGNIYAKAFGVENRIEASCCAGIGIDRLIYALRSRRLAVPLSIG